MIKYFLIFSIFLSLFACSKQELEPSIYHVQIKNSYFEPIDSIKLGTNYINQLKVDSISKKILLKKGNYTFSCITKSSLKITANIDLKGLKQAISIQLNRKGKVEIE